MVHHIAKEVATDDIRLNKRNARKHSKRQVGQIANSIRRFGFLNPVLIDENSELIGGEGRWLAAKTLGLKQIPALQIFGLSDVEKRALMIADNKIGDNSTFDRSLLAAEIYFLETACTKIDLDTAITGFSPAEIDGLLFDLVDRETDPSDLHLPHGRSPQIAVSKRGDLWKLGHHFLLCGDATCEDDYHRLMGSDRAAMVFADAPYNVEIGKTVGRGKSTYREFKEASGEKTPPQFIAFLKSSLKLLVQFSADGSIHYVCMDWRHIWELLTAARGTLDLKNIVVWAKTNAGQGSFYRSQHELIAVFKNGSSAHLNNIELGRNGRNRTNLWTVAGVNTFRAGRMDDLSIHPTVKPVALVADAMRDCTKRGDIVLDPFLGSGTTILAAERVGRRAFGMEIDPLYVDAAIRRWQAYTKRDAVLNGTKQTFDELAAAIVPSKRGRNET